MTSSSWRCVVSRRGSLGRVERGSGRGPLRRAPAAIALCASLSACAPEPLAFTTGDASAPHDASTPDVPGSDAALDAVPDAAPPAVYLLVRPDLVDPTVAHLRFELEAFGITFSELLPSEVSSIAASRSVFVAGFSTRSESWATAAPELLGAVSSGSWLLTAAFALFLLDDAGVEAVMTTDWQPACNNEFYFVRPVVPGSSPLLQGIPTWDPPEEPDRPAQSLAQVLATGTILEGAALAGDAALWTKHSFWELVAKSCGGPPTESSYCVGWGGCTQDRWVQEDSIIVRAFGAGRVAHFHTVGVVPGYFTWGPASAHIRSNFVQWAIANTSKR